MGNFERFAEQALPSIDKFYSEKIKMRDFGDYLIPFNFRAPFYFAPFIFRSPNFRAA